MADSLRDQLLKSGIVKQAQQERTREPRRPARKGGKPDSRAKAAAGGGTQEIDLAKAYAMRTQTEGRERRQLEKEAAETARLRRERKLKIQKLLEGNTLNKAETDQVRNFEYGGKIRRVHVDAAQLVALNAGELGLVQQAGRYLLVSRDIAEQVRAIDARQLALLVDPGETGMGEDGVPDDLMW